MRKLPVFRSVGEVFAGVTSHYFQLVFVAWPALVLLFLCVVAGYRLLDAAGIGAVVELAQRNPSQEELAAVYAAVFGALPLLETVGVWLLFVLGSAVMAVRWHRFVLLGESRPVLLRAEDIRYIWTTLKISVVLMVIAITLVLAIGAVVTGAGFLFGLIKDVSVEGSFLRNALTLISAAVLVPLIVIGYAVFIAMIFRVSLALPDAAIGGRSVLAVLRGTRGNTWRILAYVLLVVLASIVLTFVITLVVSLAVAAMAAFGGLGQIVGVGAGTVFGIAVYAYLLMLQITMLSVAYREIVGLPGDAGPAIASEPFPAA